MLGAAQQAYKRTQVQTASPEQLVLMLYDAARTRVNHARIALASGDRELARSNILKAQAIVGELTASLDMKTGEIARNLFRLYEYMNYQLIEANLRQRPDALDPVGRMLTELREAWAAIQPQAGPKHEASDVAV
jgi:flagellar protein FliS